MEGFFYNPNIHPEEEYKARIEETRSYASRLCIRVHEAAYDADMWFRAVKGLEKEPEGGRRCEVCCRIRIGRTAEFAASNNFEVFATTLSVSPHKRAETINDIGKIIAGRYSVNFYAADFKKNDGFKKAVAMSKEAGLYRQNYCGCIYSKNGLERK